MKFFKMLIAAFILAFICSHANAFTINTRLLKTEEVAYKNLKLDESTYAQIDVQMLLPQCRYIKFIPYYYMPIIENRNEAPQVSFKVRCISPAGKEIVVDCAGWSFSVSVMLPVGREKLCDPGHEESKFSYKVTNISGPIASFIKEKGVYAIKRDQPLDVKIDFDIKFAGKWFSTQEQINAFAAAIPKPPVTGSPTTPTGPTAGPGQQPLPLVQACSSCSSIVQCLACLQLSFVNSLRLVWLPSMPAGDVNRPV